MTRNIFKNDLVGVPWFLDRGLQRGWRESVVSWLLVLHSDNLAQEAQIVP